MSLKSLSFTLNIPSDKNKSNKDELYINIINTWVTYNFLARVYLNILKAIYDKKFNKIDFILKNEVNNRDVQQALINIVNKLLDGSEKEARNFHGPLYDPNSTGQGLNSDIDLNEFNRCADEILKNTDNIRNKEIFEKIWNETRGALPSFLEEDKTASSKRKFKKITQDKKNESEKEFKKRKETQYKNLKDSIEKQRKQITDNPFKVLKKYNLNGKILSIGLVFENKSAEKELSRAAFVYAVRYLKSYVEIKKQHKEKILKKIEKLKEYDVYKFEDWWTKVEDVEKEIEPKFLLKRKHIDNFARFKEDFIKLINNNLNEYELFEKLDELYLNKYNDFYNKKIYCTFLKRKNWDLLKNDNIEEILNIKISFNEDSKFLCDPNFTAPDPIKHPVWLPYHEVINDKCASNHLGCNIIYYNNSNNDFWINVLDKNNKYIKIFLKKSPNKRIKIKNDHLYLKSPSIDLPFKFSGGHLEFHDKNILKKIKGLNLQKLNLKNLSTNFSSLLEEWTNQIYNIISKEKCIKFKLVMAVDIEASYDKKIKEAIGKQYAKKDKIQNLYNIPIMAIDIGQQTFGSYCIGYLDENNKLNYELTGSTKDDKINYDYSDINLFFKLITLQNKIANSINKNNPIKNKLLKEKNKIAEYFNLHQLIPILDLNKLFLELDRLVVSLYKKIKETSHERHFFTNIPFARLEYLDNIRRCDEKFKVRWIIKNNKYIKKPQSKSFKYRRHLRNLSDDICRKTASQLVNKALEKECKIIVLEKLSIYTSENNSKHKNKRISLWAPKKLISLIKEYASAYGIVVVEVNPAYTSLFTVTGTPVYRNKKNPKQAIYLRDGQIQELNADINASMNILKRFFQNIIPSNNITIIEYANNKYATLSYNEGKSYEVIKIDGAFEITNKEIPKKELKQELRKITILKDSSEQIHKYWLEKRSFIKEVERRLSTFLKE